MRTVPPKLTKSALKQHIRLWSKVCLVGDMPAISCCAQKKSLRLTNKTKDPSCRKLRRRLLSNKVYMSGESIPGAVLAQKF